jgi:hypothetical protein
MSFCACVIRTARSPGHSDSKTLFSIVDHERTFVELQCDQTQREDQKFCTLIPFVLLVRFVVR